MPIAIADHHPIGLDHQQAWRWSMFVSWRLVQLLDVSHAAALLAFQFGTHPFGLRAQGLAPDVDSREIRQQLGGFTKGGDGAQCRLPTRQTVTGLLIRRQRQRLVRRTPAMTFSPTVIPPALQFNRTQACLDAALAPRLHPVSLLAVWTPRRTASRVALESRRGYLQHTFQQRRRRCAPRGEHAILVFGQAAIPMCSGMLQQRPAKLN
jgi:hypothetical protein